MAATLGSTIQGKTVSVHSATFQTAALANTVLAPATSTTILLGELVPADGAELVAAGFTVTAAGTGGGSHQWSLSDGTNALFPLAATINTTAAGTVLPMVLTATAGAGGKTIATTAGSRLTLTNTVAGTITTAIAGIFRLVWAL